uniref:protein-lysine 6-oxidase n=1 Tax=Hemiscolopendra marginata TaxID=943146 RepID=A0A646QGM2_9MYRI
MLCWPFIVFLLAGFVLLETSAVLVGQPSNPTPHAGEDDRLSNALVAIDLPDGNRFLEELNTAGTPGWTTTAPTAPSESNNVPSSHIFNLTGRAIGGRRRYNDGHLRLVGGRTSNEGNVEIFHLGKWGSVCDDEWDIREAHVACRQLGFPKAEKPTDNSEFGMARKRVWMDNLYCYGDEKNLTDCQFDGWGMHDCTPREAAGVVCADPRTTTQLTTTTVATTELPREELMHDAPGPKLSIRNAMLAPMQVRLVGGRVREEGRIEVRFGDGAWGLICGDGWGMLEATVVCRMLGLGYAQAPVQSNFFGGQHLGMVLSGVQCTGRETSLADCLHHQMGWVFCPGRTQNIAGVMCTEIAPDLVLDYLEIERSAYLEDRQLFFLQCAMEENCLARTAYRHDRTTYGWQLDVRRLLRFTARSHNLGTADFRPVLPKHLWEWHLCHMHYHSMEVFAHFDILDSFGNKIAEGHKASFCLEDNQCQPGIQPKYACANYGDQGISVGCTDTYLHNVDCQWIDITDISPGYYFFKVSINPEFKIAEISYDNNAALCNLYYNTLSVHIWNCTLMRP